MTTIKIWVDGAKVNGKYCDIPFSGKLNSSKSRNTPDWRGFIFFIDLDSQITLFGEIRKNIEIYSAHPDDKVDLA